MVMPSRFYPKYVVRPTRLSARARLIRPPCLVADRESSVWLMLERRSPLGRSDGHQSVPDETELAHSLAQTGWDESPLAQPPPLRPGERHARSQSSTEAPAAGAHPLFAKAQWRLPTRMRVNLPVPVRRKRSLKEEGSFILPTRALLAPLHLSVAREKRTTQLHRLLLHFSHLISGGTGGCV